jgi:hypothetical protein
VIDLIISGQFSGNDQARAQGCGYLTYALDSNVCNATTIAAFNAGSLDGRGEMSLIQDRFESCF